jgi:hypothetical protein
MGFKEQIKNAVLNYLDENEEAGQRAKFAIKANHLRNRFGVNADPNAAPTVAAQAQARTNQRMATERFGAGSYAGAGNTAAAQDASKRQRIQTNKRFQTSRRPM